LRGSIRWTGRRRTAANVAAGKRRRRRKPPRESRARPRRTSNDREPNARGPNVSDRNARFSGNCPYWRKNADPAARRPDAPNLGVKNRGATNAREMNLGSTNPDAMTSDGRDIGVTMT
jgi:hypothetical protein